MQFRITKEQRIPHRLLSRYGDVDGMLDANLEALDRVESRRFSVTATIGESVSSSGDADKMGSALAAVESIIATLEEEAAQLEDNFQTAHWLIGEVSKRDRDAGLVLSYYYEGGLPASEIASKMGCSAKTVYALIHRGLDHAFDVLAEED